MASDLPQLYHQDYRHLDSLIWQVPTWASAIFVLAIVASSGVLSNVGNIEIKLNIDPIQSLSVFMFAIFTVVTLLGNVLIRFRLHQGAIGLLSGVKVPRPWWQPRGGTSLLLIIFIEAAVLLDFAIILAGCSAKTGGAFSVSLLLVVFPFVEYLVLRTIKNAEKIRANSETNG